MKTIFVLAACAALAACTKDNTDTTRTTSATTAETADNTKLNERDLNGANPTSGNQSNAKADIAISAEIRKAVVADDGLSMDAKNVKIVTQDGVVILRGPVKSDAEKDLVGSKASAVAGVTKVENHLDVISEKRGNQ